jgi:hypothetical protein
MLWDFKTGWSDSNLNNAILKFSKRSDEVEERLKFDQIAALRFAYDDEFKELLYKALHENISGDDIKKSIQNWRPDLHRI